jgi:Xaa-Pro aminopeptidase
MLVSSARIVLKSPREIELMRAAGRVVHRVLEELGRLVRPGVTTAELDARAAKLIEAAGATAVSRTTAGGGGAPGFRALRRFPAPVVPFPARAAIRVLRTNVSP